MSKSIWKIQALSKPTSAHAADAIEIVNGETVRRVTLPQLDYDVYIAYSLTKADAQHLAEALKLAVDVTAATLNRLTAAGLIDQAPKPVIQ